MGEKIRVRFAPAPTGYLHVGGARTALFNWLFARRYGGDFVLRSEDTDLGRSSLESEHVIQEAMRWLGLDWDEGPDIGGLYGPYRQTERIELYRQHAEKLLSDGKVYRCYCTEEELKAKREQSMAQGITPRYDGRCRQLSREEEEKFIAEGRPVALRFRVGENETIVVEDLILGRVEFKTDEISDFIIIKSNSTPSYNFAVVIDDGVMRITHVIRGNEHLTNTARQILLYRALGFSEPVFAHVPMILAKDRSKLSKRHGTVSVGEYQKAGYLPEAIMNYLVLLGWSPPSEQEVYSLEELKGIFSLDRVGKAAAVFDDEKLLWFNGCYIRHSTPEKLLPYCLPYWQKAGFVNKDLAQLSIEEKKVLEGIIASVQDNLTKLNEIAHYTDIYFVQEFAFSQEALEVLQSESAKKVICGLYGSLSVVEQLTAENFKTLMKDLQKELKVKGKDFFMPVRVALTGRTHGPELANLMPLLPKETALNRLKKALLKVEETALKLS